MSDRPSNTRSTTAAVSQAKALLLCAHAEELSIQCTTALRHGPMDGLLEMQARKHTIVEELTGMLKTLEVAQFPDLQGAVERLRSALRIETRLLADASNNLQNELLTVNAAQRRLTQARRYDTAAESPFPAGGSQLSVSG